VLFVFRTIVIPVCRSRELLEWVGASFAQCKVMKFYNVISWTAVRLSVAVYSLKELGGQPKFVFNFSFNYHKYRIIGRMKLDYKHGYKDCTNQPSHINHGRGKGAVL
jgi:hypothetical protein